MKTVSFILVTLLSIFLFSCLGDDQPTKVKPVIQDSIEVVTDTLSIDIGWCFDILNFPEQARVFTYVIKDSSDYISLIGKKFPNKFCDSVSLPLIDFNKYTLIGRYIDCSGSSFTNSKIEKTVFKKYFEKKYVYFIRLDEIFAYNGSWFTFNWLLIPKLQEGWSVDFDSTYTFKYP